MPSLVAKADSLVKPPTRKAPPFLAARRRLIQMYRDTTNESRARQPPPHGEERPEDAAIADFPHPQPFLYPASEKREDGDDGNDRDRSGNHPPHGAPHLWALLARMDW